MRVLRLEVFVDNVYVINQFQITFAQGSGGELVDVTVNSKEENYNVSQLRPRIRPQERQR